MSVFIETIKIIISFFKILFEFMISLFVTAVNSGNWLFITICILFIAVPALIVVIKTMKHIFS